MDIKNILGGANPYTQTKVEQGEETGAAAKLAAKAKAKSASSTGDRVSVSEDAKLMAEAAKRAQEAPDVRVDRVEALRAQVQSGTYTPDSRQIAQKMVDGQVEFMR